MSSSAFDVFGRASDAGSMADFLGNISDPERIAVLAICDEGTVHIDARLR